MKKTAALFEDTTMAYNRWVQGIASRELTASRVGLSDILDDKKAKPLGSKVVKDIPLHPTLSKTPELVGTMLISLSNMEAKIRMALASNMAEDPEKTAILRQLLLIAKHNKRMTRRMINCFEKLS